MKRLLLLIWGLLPFMTLAQGRTCGTEQAMQQLEFNPLMKAIYNQQKQISEQQYQNFLNNPNLVPSPTTASTLTIPVAVHFPSSSSASSTLRNCLKQLAQTQIDILNEDYNGTNADISTWNTYQPIYYPAINNGVMNVQFELATQNHPVSSGLTNGEVAVTFGGGFTGSSDWDPNWAGYLNLVVKDIGSGLLGYAYKGSNPATGAAVFINTFAFGSGSGCSGYQPSAPYNLGRTLTHELGHYMNLDHIWGNAYCGNDNVADTPLHNTDNGGCPSLSHLSTCTGTPRELHMNFMDYTNDACMYMFTAGQATRMQAHISSIQSNFNYNTLAADNFDFDATKVALYPNPSNGSFDITLSNNNLIDEVFVYDVTGRIVFKQSNILEEAIHVDVSNSNAGVYNVIVKSDGDVYNSKIVVK